MNKIIYLAAFSFLFTACNNSNSLRLDPSLSCTPEDDPAQFELFESEEDLLVLTSALPASTNFQLDYENVTIDTPENITLSLKNNLVSAPDLTTGLMTISTSFNCVSGFSPENTPSGTLALTYPISNESGSLVSGSTNVTYGSTEGEFSSFDISTEAQASPAASFVDFYTSQGFTTNIYTFKEGDSKDKIFLIHSKSADGKQRIRTRIIAL